MLYKNRLALGFHGRGVFSRFFLGSVVENIMRLAPIPAFLVHAPYKRD